MPMTPLSGLPIVYQILGDYLPYKGHSVNTMFPRTLPYLFAGTQRTYPKQYRYPQYPLIPSSSITSIVQTYSLSRRWKVWTSKLSFKAYLPAGSHYSAREWHLWVYRPHYTASTYLSQPAALDIYGAEGISLPRKAEYGACLYISLL